MQNEVDVINEIEQAVMSGNLTLVNSLIYKDNPPAYEILQRKKLALKYAIAGVHEPIIANMIHELSGVSDAVKFAASYGHGVLLRKLLFLADGSTKSERINDAVEYGALHGHVEIVNDMMDMNASVIYAWLGAKKGPLIYRDKMPIFVAQIKNQELFEKLISHVSANFQEHDKYILESIRNIRDIMIRYKVNYNSAAEIDTIMNRCKINVDKAMKVHAAMSSHDINVNQAIALINNKSMRQLMYTLPQSIINRNTNSLRNPALRFCLLNTLKPAHLSIVELNDLDIKIQANRAGKKS